MASPPPVKTREDPPRLALSLGVISLILWPFSYAWIPNANNNPQWILVLVPVAELGAVVCAIAAIWLGRRARRSGTVSRGGTWALRLGALTLILMVLAFVAASFLYR